MTTQKERQALADFMRQAHQHLESLQLHEDEFTVIDYAETNGISIDEAGLEIRKLLRAGAVTFSRKVIDRDKERNAYKFVDRQ